MNETENGRKKERKKGKERERKKKRREKGCHEAIFTLKRFSRNEEEEIVLCTRMNVFYEKRCSLRDSLVFIVVVIVAFYFAGKRE